MNGDGAIKGNSLMQVLHAPANALRFDARQWEDLLWHARITRLSGRIWYLFEQSGMTDRVPEPIRRRLYSAFLEAEYHRRQLLWEIDRIHRAFYGSGRSFVVMNDSSGDADRSDVGSRDPGTFWWTFRPSPLCVH